MTGGLKPFSHSCHGVKLIKIEVLRLQKAKRFLEFGVGFLPGALVSFAGKEDFVSLSDERGPEPLLRVAVDGRDVEVIDPTFHCRGYAPVGLGLRRTFDDDAAQADDRKHLSGLP